MIQEYLLQDLSEKDAIKAYKPEGVQKRMFSADKGNCWYVQFSADGENEETAKRLSELDTYIQTSFHVTVLESGCSAYFNKRLYPLINEFENDLRKLLYLTSAINRDEKSATNIANLESQDFGQIFTMLFIDNSFMGKVKEDVKNRNRDFFSKAEVITAIESVDENTFWDEHLGKDSVPTLRKRFIDARTYRNDVMHSHHISWERFRKILALYKAINTEMDKAIHEIEVVESKAPSKPTFNQALEGVLRTQEMLAAIADAMKPSILQAQRISEMFANSELAALQQQIKEFYAANAFTPEVLRELSQLGQLASEYLQSAPSLSQKSDGATDGEATNKEKPKEESNPEEEENKGGGAQ